MQIDQKFLDTYRYDYSAVIVNGESRYLKLAYSEQWQHEGISRVVGDTPHKTITVEEPSTVQGGNYAIFNLAHKCLLGAEIVIRGSVEAIPTPHKLCLDSSIEFEQGGQRGDRQYLFTQGLLSRMLYGIPEQRKVTIEHGRVEIVIPLYFDLFSGGNVFVPAYWHPARINVDFKSSFDGIESKSRREPPLDISYVLRTTYLDIHMGSGQMIKNPEKADSANSLEFNWLRKPTPTDRWGVQQIMTSQDGYHFREGSKMMYQLQYTGVERLGSDGPPSNNTLKIRLNFNHPCLGLYIMFTEDDSHVVEENLLSEMFLTVNGHQAVIVDAPARILGTCPQFPRDTPEFNSKVDAICSTRIDLQIEAKQAAGLPADVWTLIFGMVTDTKDLCSLMSTCRYLWRVGHKRQVVERNCAKLWHRLPGWYCIPFTDRKLLGYHDTLGECPNFSRIDNAALCLTFSRPFNGCAHLVALNYNVIRKMSGMYGLGFSM